MIIINIIRQIFKSSYLQIYLEIQILDVFFINLVKLMVRKLKITFTKASLNESFMEDFMTLNIINFANMVRREKDVVS